MITNRSQVFLFEQDSVRINIRNDGGGSSTDSENVFCFHWKQNSEKQTEIKGLNQWKKKKEEKIFSLTHHDDQAG